MQCKTTRAASLRWALAATAILTAGCGSSSPGGSAPPAEAASAAADSPDQEAGADGNDFTFPEDTDPAVAALPFVEDELLARTLPGADPDELDAAYAQAGATVLQVFPDIETTALQVEPGELRAVASRLSANPLVEAIQKNYLYEPERTPDDPKFDTQDYLELLGLPDAWDITTGAADLIIAVLDTGVAGDHPDLAGKLLVGWNTFYDTGDTDDVLGHGTSVAGVVAAASDNGVGLAGVSWESPIMPVRVTNAKGLASSRAIAAGLVWATDHGARVLNVSFAPLASDPTVLQAARYVRNAGGLVFISAGNEGRRLTAGDNKNAIFVGATDSSNQLAEFSTYGPFVDLVAPGTAIQTTTRSGGYQRKYGTSFASPIAAGTAALVWAVRPELRPVTVESILADTAVDLGTGGRDDRFGAGLVDAAAAVAQAQDIIELEDHTAPRIEMTKPKDGASVSSVIRVVASATDTEGVADVVLSIDGQPFATDTAAPYKFAVNSNNLADGIHTLTCVATDSAGNSSTPASAQILVGEESSGTGGGSADTVDPTVVINFPVDGTSVVGSVGMQATATDNLALSRVQWLVDGATRKTTAISGTRAVVSFVWDTGTSSGGEHTITVRVTDTSDNHALVSVRLTSR